MGYIDFLSSIHKRTSRDYLARVTEFPKAEAATLAKRWDLEYWDGDRRTGYGGFRYDGRWRAVAEAMVRHYSLTAESRILDVGCGKAFLLYEFTQLLPGVHVAGLDISHYGLVHAKPEVQSRLVRGTAARLPFPSASFDFVFSITTLHNLYCFDLHEALREIERVGRARKYICVESYRSEAEKVNLLYWQLTCEMFCTPAEWDWWFRLAGYTGDHSFIYFE